MRRCRGWLSEGEEEIQGLCPLLDPALELPPAVHHLLLLVAEAVGHLRASLADLALLHALEAVREARVRCEARRRGRSEAQPATEKDLAVSWSDSLSPTHPSMGAQGPLDAALGPPPLLSCTHLHLGLEGLFPAQLLVFLLQPLHTVQIFPTVQGLDQGRPGEEAGVTIALCSSSSLVAEGRWPQGFCVESKWPSRFLLSHATGLQQAAGLTRCPSCCEGGRFPRNHWSGGSPAAGTSTVWSLHMHSHLTLIPSQGIETDQPGCVGTRRAVRTELSARPEQGTTFLTGCFSGCVQFFPPLPKRLGQAPMRQADT